MILLLTSSPTGDLDGKYTCEGFDTRNGFAEEVRKVWRDRARVLMITAFPANKPANLEMCAFFEDAVRRTGLSGSAFDLWDRDILFQPERFSKEQLLSYDVILLGGCGVRKCLSDCRRGAEAI